MSKSKSDPSACHLLSSERSGLWQDRYSNSLQVFVTVQDHRPAPRPVIWVRFRCGEVDIVASAVGMVRLFQHDYPTVNGAAVGLLRETGKILGRLQ